MGGPGAGIIAAGLPSLAHASLPPCLGSERRVQGWPGRSVLCALEDALRSCPWCCDGTRSRPELPLLPVGRKQVLKNSRPDMILKPGSALSCETRGMSCEVSASSSIKWVSRQPLPGGLAGVDHSWGGQSHCLSGSVPIICGGALGAPGSWGISARLPRATRGHSLNRLVTLSLGRCRGSHPLPPHRQEAGPSLSFLGPGS